MKKKGSGQMSNDTLYLETGPEPTTGIRNNREVRTDAEIKMMAIAMFLIGAVLVYLMQMGRKFGITIAGQFVPAAVWDSTTQYRLMRIAAIIAEALCIMHIISLAIRKHSRKAARKGKVVGFRRSGKNARQTRNMDLVVETERNGKKELVRVTTQYGQNSKKYYRPSDTVYFYSLGKRFFTNDL